MRLGFRTLTPVIAVVVLAACNQTPQPSPMTVDDAKTLKLVAPQVMNGLAGSIRGGGAGGIGTSGFTPEQVARMAGVQTLGATPQADTGNCGATGEVVDADGDGIPNSFSYDYNCTVVIGDFTYKATGNKKAADLSDADANSGFTSSGNLKYEFLFANNPADNFVFEVRWNTKVTVAATGAATLTTDNALVLQPNTDRFAEFAFKLDATYTPDADGNTKKFDAGVIALNGTSSFKDAKGKFASFKLTATDVHFGGSCPRAVDRGSLVIEDAQNIAGQTSNKLEITATGCDTFSAKFNGSASF
ncbi:MAG: hypothetical protein HC933_21315 [Pleurocapsa sp. SU_196_0]|nr:hypothetical protein [Pleurocapsa sp. SU_196_0]